MHGTLEVDIFVPRPTADVTPLTAQQFFNVWTEMSGVKTQHEDWVLDYLRALMRVCLPREQGPDAPGAQHGRAACAERARAARCR